MDQIKDLDQNNITIQEENKHRILVVAPADEERHRLTGLLERENNTVVEFGTTLEVLEHLETLTQPEETQLISMLIVNWSLSDTALSKLIRHLQQGPFSHLPLVALTDSSCIEINEAMMFLKHTAVIEKPVKTSAMLVTLQKFLVQPELPTPNRSAEAEYYSFLESNTLLELAIKNNQNHHNDSLNEESVSDSVN